MRLYLSLLSLVCQGNNWCASLCSCHKTGFVVLLPKSLVRFGGCFFVSLFQEGLLWGLGFFSLRFLRKKTTTAGRIHRLEDKSILSSLSPSPFLHYSTLLPSGEETRLLPCAVRLATTPLQIKHLKPLSQTFTFTQDNPQISTSHAPSTL